LHSISLQTQEMALSSLIFFFGLAVLFGLAIWYLMPKESAGSAPPGCGRCGYPLGSWSSPKCPECGADVRETGVRTGARRVGRLAFVLVVLPAPLVAGAAGAGAAKLTEVTRGNSSFSFSPPGPDLFVIVRGTSVTRRFPPIEQRTMEATLLRVPPDSPRVTRAFQWGGESPLAERMLTIDPDNLPDQTTIMAAWRDVLGPNADDARVRELSILLRRALRESVALSGPRLVSPPSVQGFGGGSGGGSSTSSGASFPLTILVVFIAWSLGGRWLSRRLGRPALRDVHDGEWSTG
jgi:hypothetical protein